MHTLTLTLSPVLWIVIDPQAYPAKYRKISNEDNHSFHKVMHKVHTAEYQKAAATEVTYLMRQNIWKRVSRHKVPTNKK